jgi:HSP20 family protein
MSWLPPVDVTEYGDHFELFVDLPGVDPASVELMLEEGVLTLKGERANAATPEARAAGARLWRAERGRGQFERRFVLPDAVDADQVQAKTEHGVLRVSIPKRAQAVPQRIKIAA